MNLTLKTLFFLALTSAIGLANFFYFPGYGALSAAAALLIAWSIRHRTVEQAISYMFAAFSALCWVGATYTWQNDFLVSFMLANFSAACLLLILIVNFSEKDKSTSSSKEEMESFFGIIARDIAANHRNKQDRKSNSRGSQWSLRRVLQIALWICIAATLILLFYGQTLAALAVNIAAITLTFAYESSSLGRLQSTYAAFATLCLIGALSITGTDVTLIWILFAMFGYLALTTKLQ